jgi:manganese efflux pump family protein
VSFGRIFLLAFGLAMDATAAAAARGLAAPKIFGRNVWRVALLFGGFQALMPLLGWLVGARVGPWVEAWDHWIAFFVLSVLGAKMLWEARQGPEPDPLSEKGDAFGWGVLVMLAIATSIDAFAVGITLPMLNAPLLLSLATIGFTTALLSALGVFAGRRFGAMLGKRLDILGGIVLIGFGTKILFEHLAQG